MEVWEGVEWIFITGVCDLRWLCGRALEWLGWLEWLRIVCFRWGGDRFCVGSLARDASL
jgi:hypothetical protein